MQISQQKLRFCRMIRPRVSSSRTFFGKNAAVKCWLPVSKGLAAIGAFFSTHSAIHIDHPTDFVNPTKSNGPPSSDWTSLTCSPVSGAWKSASVCCSENASLMTLVSLLRRPPEAHQASAEVSCLLLPDEEPDTPCTLHKGTDMTEGIHYAPTLEARPQPCEQLKEISPDQPLHLCQRQHFHVHSTSPSQAASLERCTAPPRRPNSFIGLSCFETMRSFLSWVRVPPTRVLGYFSVTTSGSWST